jgi:hypothetical protein
MLAGVYSCAGIGLDGVVVEAEVDYTSGFPGMIIIGLFILLFKSAESVSGKPCAMPW